MAQRGRIRCFICDNANIPRAMVSLSQDENDIKRQISITRREEQNRPAMNILPDTRICLNCNISVTREINILENDPQCLRLNVLTQTTITLV